MKCGKTLCFHGSFTSKARAMKKEAEARGRFILQRGDRFLVVSKRPAKKRRAR